ncbi:hypothetical protein [Aliiruegeria lutimaris]|uniref:5-aminolevulic acid synthase n=1 Tax=Aliiruegeria lutimaris TaxID=571298 RepID=A0A1G9PBQ7_9RHOB|nr:hypothetical protein [Aliiruegeria lutimaris]SDL96302.1 hypothetical protein SAMN04488026_11385 [Aliiruegeria lutimaris]
MRISAPVRILATALILAAPLAQAQTIDSRTAKKMLFGTSSDVTLGQADLIDSNVAKAIKQAGKQIPYYGAIAVSPGEPTSSNLMPTIGNLHSAESAQKAALDNCNARRTVGGPCVVIATITPKRYKAQPLTLSVGATQYFGKEYRKMDAPKAFAISPSTGAFGADRGDGGRALSKCAAAAKGNGGSDCRLVIADQ